MGSPGGPAEAVTGVAARPSPRGYSASTARGAGGTRAVTRWEEPMRIRDLMTPHVHAIGADLAAAEARERMAAAKCHHLVVEERGQIAGVVSERDLGGRRGRPPDATVRELMSRDVATLAPGATLRQAANLLRGRGIGCVPVVEEGRLVGIVTISDVLDVVGRGAVHLTERTRPYQRRRQGPPRKAPAPRA